MIKYLIIALFILHRVLLCASDYSTWLSPDPATQLKQEAKDDELGYGRLFVPAISMPGWEPEYKVYTSDGKVAEGLKTGESYFFKPGNYRLMLGSALDSYDRIQKDFTIREQETAIIEPDWGGLIIKAIDENREGIRMGYEIFHYNSEISLGIKYTKADNEYDDRQATWLLPPGKYKLVKYGEPYNTLLNFTTFELKAGELKKMTVVKDSKTALIVGAGELPEEQFEFATARDWRSYLYLRGQLSFSGNNNISENDHESVLDFKGKVDNHIKYDKQPYYLSLRQTVENGFSRTNSEDYRISADLFKLDNTGIYYFTKVLGIYMDLDLSTKLFPATIFFDQPGEVQILDAGGRLREKRTGQREFALSPSLYPLTLREEGGLNFSFIKTAEANLYLRTGFGFIQKQNVRVYSKTGETDTSITVQSLPNEQVKGYVLAAGLDWQLPGNISYNGEGNFFYSLDKKEDYEAVFDNNLNFKFLKYLSLDYTLNLLYNSKDRYIKYSNRLALEFSYYLNY